MSESRFTVDEPLVYKAPSSDRSYVRLNHALFALAACLSVILPLIALLMLQVLALREEVAVMRSTVNNLSEQRNLIQDLVAFEDETTHKRSVCKTPPDVLADGPLYHSHNAAKTQ
uniref:Uncharacterized protein n=1 Tax=Timema monikensis TaxID=170555 RepID=A0A7R9E714_9NEOP|nr:unnamed protein product [Timema monikensis]